MIFLLAHGDKKYQSDFSLIVNKESFDKYGYIKAISPLRSLLDFKY